jgi:acyl-coenzyme A thioesterase PaaI-like protein
VAEHRCYACEPANADRIVTAVDGGWRLRFPDRFAGPPGTVNGGMAIGTLACPALDAAARAGVAHPVATRVSGRLTAPVPLAASLRATVERVDEGWAVEALDGDRSLMRVVVEVADLDVAPGAALQQVSAEQAEHVAAMASLTGANPDGPTFWERMRERGDENPFPGCFSCGPDQEHGLRIFPRLAGEREVWSRWRPEPSFTDGGGVLAGSVAASALDCSTALVFQFDDDLARRLRDEGKAAIPVLGAFDVRMLRVPPVALDGDYRVIARRIGQQGRRLFGVSALFDRDGLTYATAEATWFTIDRTG